MKRGKDVRRNSVVFAQMIFIFASARQVQFVTDYSGLNKNKADEIIGETDVDLTSGGSRLLHLFQRLNAVSK